MIERSPQELALRAELPAMTRIDRVLRDLDEELRGRIERYLVDRYVTKETTT